MFCAVVCDKSLLLLVIYKLSLLPLITHIFTVVGTSLVKNRHLMNNSLSVILKFKACSIQRACCNHMPLSNILKYKEGNDLLHLPIRENEWEMQMGTVLLAMSLFSCALQ
jgi:hypothetical protein